MNGLRAAAAAAAAAIDLIQSRSCNRRGWECQEAVAWIVGLLDGGIRGYVGNFDAYRTPAHQGADLLYVFLVHPGLETTPPQGRTNEIKVEAGTRVRGRVCGRGLDSLC